jgi:carbon monoxide dehydrogenase subunit G
MANLQFEGEETFAAPRERVYSMLVDLDALPEGIPDLASSKRIDAETLEAVVRPGFSFLRGTMKLRISLHDLTPPSDATMQIDASGIGVSMKVVSHIQLADDPATGGTKVVWRAEVSNLKGLVATVSPGLVRAAADQIVHNGWKRLHERL